MSVLLLMLVAAAMGNWVFGRTERFELEALTYRLYAGMFFAATLIIVAGSVSLRYAQALIFTLAVVSIILEVKKRKTKDDALQRDDVPRTPLAPLEKICLLTLIVANSLTFIAALAPNTQWDAGVAHLALPSDYAREGAIGLVEGNVYSAYPHALHTLYTFTFFQGGETTTAVLSWLFGAMGCVAMFGLGRRVESRQCGFIAAAIFCTAPVFFDQGGVVSLDVAFAGMTIAALACLAAWHQERKLSWLLLAATIAGGSAGVRHTGYITCVLLALGVLIIASDSRSKSFVLFGVVAFCAALPWLVRSAMVSGNPVYPFLGSLFPAETMPDVQTTTFLHHESIQGKGVKDFVMFPWNIVMRPNWFDGWAKSPGVLLFALGLPGLVIGGAKARALGAFSISGGILFFFFQRFARYILPFFAPMMVVAAIAACRLERFKRPVAILLVFTFTYGLTLGAAAVHFKIPAALGLESREAYLAKRVDRYIAFEWANRNLDQDATVFTLDPRSYFLNQPTYQNFEMFDSLGAMTLNQQMDWFRSRNIRYFFYPKEYVESTPIYIERGFLDTLQAWWKNTHNFRLIHTQFEPHRKGLDAERVEFYEIYYDGEAQRVIQDELRERMQNDEP